MDIPVPDLPVFLAATFLGSVVAGLSGFAFGLVAAAIWLHVLDPVQSAALIVGYGLIVQGQAVWKLRRAIDWPLLWPMLAGTAAGIPAGVGLLAWLDADPLRRATGLFLVLYSLYGLLRPDLPPLRAGRAADMAAGLVNGVVAGATGLGGIIAAVWCGLRGWPKDRQRAIFQPVAVAAFVMSGAWLGASGTLAAGHLAVATGWLFVAGLPLLLAGTWLGLRLYGRLSEAAFRRVVLLLLLASGAALAA
ncbi:sulfite exporter TauE/SafE family protein [Ferrovibrio sp.]|uniref:sulfite exporter TauE/SafE family protein n=1 Tax=Ferrovibrio sp. TaxID=1917215 RepID=UPI0035110B3C